MSSAIERVLRRGRPIDWKSIQRIVKRQKGFGILCQSLDQILGLEEGSKEDAVPKEVIETIFERLEWYDLWIDQSYLYNYRMWKDFLTQRHHQEQQQHRQQEMLRPAQLNPLHLQGNVNRQIAPQRLHPLRDLDHQGQHRFRGPAQKPTVQLDRSKEVVQILAHYYHQESLSTHQGSSERPISSEKNSSANNRTSGDFMSFLWQHYPRWAAMMRKTNLLFQNWKALVTSSVPGTTNVIHPRNFALEGSAASKYCPLLATANWPMPNIVLLLWTLAHNGTDSKYSVIKMKDCYGGNALHVAAMAVSVWATRKIGERLIPWDRVRLCISVDESYQEDFKKVSSHYDCQCPEQNDQIHKKVIKILQSTNKCTPVALLLNLCPALAKQTDSKGQIPLETMLVTYRHEEVFAHRSSHRVLKHQSSQEHESLEDDLRSLIKAAPQALSRRNPNLLGNDGRHLIPSMIPFVIFPSNAITVNHSPSIEQRYGNTFAAPDENNFSVVRSKMQSNCGLLSLTYLLLRANPMVVSLWQNKEAIIGPETPFEGVLRQRWLRAQENVKILQAEQLELKRKVEAFENERDELRRKRSRHE